MKLSCRNGTKFEFKIWPWPFDPIINRGPSWVIVNTCISTRSITLCQKVMEISCRNDANFKVQIWPWPFTFHPKIFRGLPQVMGNTFVKYHHRMKWRYMYGAETFFPQTRRSRIDRTVRQPWWKQYTPLSLCVCVQGGGGGLHVIIMYSHNICQSYMYCNLETGDTQSLKSKWRDQGSNPSPLALQAKNLTTSTPFPVSLYYMTLKRMCWSGIQIQ